MGNKKASAKLSSNISSAANPNTSSATHAISNSSILKSSFAPSRFQLSLFASVIQGLDAQHLRVHNTNGRLRCDHALNARSSIQCLDWGYYRPLPNIENPNAHADRKRKRSKQANGVDVDSADLVLALGTSDSKIQFFSPNEAKIVGQLPHEHRGGIRDFKFVRDGAYDEAWSLGEDGQLIQWNLKKGRQLWSTSAPERSASILCPIDSSLLCGSSSLRMIDPNKQLSTSYTASTHSVRSIMMQPGSSNKDLRFLTAAEFDRFINIYEEDNQYLIGCLTTESEVRRMDLWTSAAHTTSEPNGKGVSNHTSAQETLVALNNDGILELYERPFDFESASSENPSHTAKEKAKQRSRKAFARVRIVRPTGDSATVPLIDVSFDENDIIVAWAEGGVNVVFDRIRWRSEDNGQILLKGPIDIAKSKGSAGIGGAVMNGVKDVGQTQMDDSRAVVTNGVDSDEHSETESRTRKETIEISSAEEESEFEEDEGEDLAAAAEADARALINDKGNGNAEDEDEEGDEDEEMVDASPTSAYQQTKEILPDGEHEGDKEDDADNEDDASPSFGDLLRAQHPSALSAIPVSTSTNATVSHSLVPTTGNIAVSTDPSVQTHATSALSLTTLLTQSLRTSDTTLLESCLHHPSLPDIRHTIERLPPHFAPPLLARLAERLHSRPGRAGSLMVWIQWTLVAHGGYLASAGGTSTGMSAGAGIGSKEVIQQLRSLHKVVRERARGLGELLQLKGKLDMLDAQMRLRQAVMSQGRNKRKRGSRNEGEDEDEDEDVDEEDDERIVYVEGQEEEEEDDDEDEDEDAASESGSESGSGSGSISDDVDDDEELPNGIAALEEEVDLDAEDDEDDEDKANLLDMEASESEGEASDGDGAMADQDIDHDDVDTESSSSDPGSGTGSGSGSVVDVNTDVDMDEAETEEEGEEEKKRWKKKQRRT